MMGLTVRFRGILMPQQAPSSSWMHPICCRRARCVDRPQTNMEWVRQAAAPSYAAFCDGLTWCSPRGRSPQSGAARHD
jgi:hypothetical protein